MVDGQGVIPQGTEPHWELTTGTDERTFHEYIDAVEAWEQRRVKWAMKGASESSEEMTDFYHRRYRSTRLFEVYSWKRGEYVFTATRQILPGTEEDGS